MEINKLDNNTKSYPYSYKQPDIIQLNKEIKVIRSFKEAFETAKTMIAKHHLDPNEYTIGHLIELIKKDKTTKLQKMLDIESVVVWAQDWAQELITSQQRNYPMQQAFKICDSLQEVQKVFELFLSICNPEIESIEFAITSIGRAPSFKELEEMVIFCNNIMLKYKLIPSGTMLSIVWNKCRNLSECNIIIRNIDNLNIAIKNDKFLEDSFTASSTLLVKFDPKHVNTSLKELMIILQHEHLCNIFPKTRSTDLNILLEKVRFAGCQKLLNETSLKNSELDCASISIVSQFAYKEEIPFNSFIEWPAFNKKILLDDKALTIILHQSIDLESALQILHACKKKFRVQEIAYTDAVAMIINKYAKTFEDAKKILQITKNKPLGMIAVGSILGLSSSIEECEELLSIIYHKKEIDDLDEIAISIILAKCRNMDEFLIICKKYAFSYFEKVIKFIEKGTKSNCKHIMELSCVHFVFQHYLLHSTTEQQDQIFSQLKIKEFDEAQKKAGHIYYNFHLWQDIFEFDFNVNKSNQIEEYQKERQMLHSKFVILLVERLIRLNPNQKIVFISGYSHGNKIKTAIIEYLDQNLIDSIIPKYNKGAIIVDTTGIFLVKKISPINYPKPKHNIFSELEEEEKEEPISNVFVKNPEEKPKKNKKKNKLAKIENPVKVDKEIQKLEISSTKKAGILGIFKYLWLLPLF